MKVLHIAESFGGGVVTAMAEYVHSTPEIEHHLLYGHRKQTAADSWDPYTSVRTLGSGREAIRAIRRAVDELQPDVVHAQSSFAGAFTRIALRNRRVRIVYTPHCFAFERRDISPVARAAYFALERVLALNTEVLAGCSPFEARMGAQWRGAEHAIYVPNVARVDAVEAADRGAGGRPLVVGLGRLDIQKDPEWFAGVAALLRGDVDLLWVGGGTPEAEQRMRDNGIEVSGWVDRGEALKMLASASCFVSSALWEGFPMVLLEASELGVPVVMRELSALEDAPESVRVRTQAEAADLTRRVVADPADRDANLAAWRHYLRENTPAIQRERLLQAYGCGAPTETTTAPFGAVGA
ncbi:glycosyltransferase family 4 protein [Luteococcus sp.]|uniref:glycosyltransferase family 4 protein n=1 Tax=Luteococcus sp. TaxID=1969402 RepID=UPI00264881A2|nr:glycosyltransferase family 4 protein [Luteococcus sp.]